MIKKHTSIQLSLIASLVLLLVACNTLNNGKSAANNKPKDKTKEELEAEQRYPTGVEPPVYKMANARAGTVTKPRIEPSLWWIGMKNPTVEVVIYDQNIKGATIELNYPGVRVVSQSGLENPNYLFLELEISPTTLPGDVNILVKSETKYTKHKLTLKNRDANRVYAQGLTPADFVYLAMPDRFSNGDTQNDTYDDMQQRTTDRKKMYFRHGGDIQGVINHLDYLKEMGITTLWLNPVLENNQPYESYHGYAITDHYNVDKRFGTNNLYTELVTQSHKKGMKVMKDMIFNHVGSEHYFIKDLPSTDWIHNHPEFKRTNYRDQIHYDP
jgi:neopullulanase